MDLASILGLLLCLGMCVYGIIDNAGAENFGRYLDPPSAIITFGGAFFELMASTTLKEYVAGLKSFMLIFKAPANDVKGMIQKIIELSNVARKEGLLSLEEAAGDLDDEFMKKGILLIVDGTDPELVRGIMETELVSIEERRVVTRTGLQPCHESAEVRMADITRQRIQGGHAWLVLVADIVVESF